ncbi:hypothetical protein [Bacteroides acidifaciens]|uniref:hypothetical protein n=1 Tax=Bacteroides acidifaciens TaxID=85831 RepID=UPI00255807E1|nr:hypothetical protein [Bacteroides acidifaciens]
MGIDLNKLKQASDNAANRVNQSNEEEIVALVDFSNFSKILKELQKTSVKEIEIEELKKEIEKADNKNAVLLRVLRSGNTLAKALISIIHKN